MFCPKCQAEYMEGHTRCVDCGVPLVEKLPEKHRPTASTESEELVTVFTSWNQADIVVVKSLLDAAGIRYVATGEGLKSIYGIGYVEIQVRKDQVEKAIELLNN